MSAGYTLIKFYSNFTKAKAISDFKLRLRCSASDGDKD